MAFTNPNPNLHIDLLKSQYAIFSLVLKRMFNNAKDKNNGFTNKAIIKLAEELMYLELLIIEKENDISNRRTGSLARPRL